MIYNSNLNSIEKSVMIALAACGSDFTAKNLDLGVISQSLVIPEYIISKVLKDLEVLGYIISVDIEKRGRKLKHYSITQKVNAEYELVNKNNSKKRINGTKPFLNRENIGYKDD